MNEKEEIEEREEKLKAREEELEAREKEPIYSSVPLILLANLTLSYIPPSHQVLTTPRAARGVPK